jgi:hypothetical protein
LYGRLRLSSVLVNANTGFHPDLLSFVFISCTSHEAMLFTEAQPATQRRCLQDFYAGSHANAGYRPGNRDDVNKSNEILQTVSAESSKGTIRVAIRHYK